MPSDDVTDRTKVLQLLGNYPIGNEALKAYSMCVCGLPTGSSFENGWDSAIRKVLEVNHAE